MRQLEISRDSLIFVPAATQAGADPRALRRAVGRGQLVRIRRGVYCERGRWDRANARERHLLRVHAVVAHARNPITIAGPSAAAVWGVPMASPPADDVTVLDLYRGGGRSEPGVVRQTTGARSAETVHLEGVPVTTLARTVLDVARGADFPEAVAYVDWARWRKNRFAITPEHLVTELALIAPRYGRSGLARAIEFSSDLSDSFAESVTRAVIHELGFPPPVLQLPLRDAEGPMFPDFAWPDTKVILEFDGEVKYSDPRYNGGDPVEKVRAQRKREARLRRQGWTVLRAEWPDVVDRSRLAALLVGAGIPRSSLAAGGATSGRVSFRPPGGHSSS